jgi:hypothetical protein
VHAVLGLLAHKKGRLGVYGDSNCLDSSHMRSSCFRLLTSLLSYVTTVRPSPFVGIASLSGSAPSTGYVSAWRENMPECRPLVNCWSTPMQSTVVPPGNGSFGLLAPNLTFLFQSPAACRC